MVDRDLDYDNVIDVPGNTDYSVPSDGFLYADIEDTTSLNINTKPAILPYSSSSSYNTRVIATYKLRKNNVVRHNYSTTGRVKFYPYLEQ